MLCLPYKKYLFRFNGDFALSTGQYVKLTDSDFLHDPSRLPTDTGVDLWDGEIALAQYLDSNAHLVCGKSVLELGCGSFGLAGICAKILGADSVLLTDLPYCKDAVLRNCELNGVDCEFLALDWTQPPQKFPYVDVVIAADVVWVDALVEPLVATISRTLRFSRLLLAHQTRSRAVDAKFFSLLEIAGFRISVLEDLGELKILQVSL